MNNLKSYLQTVQARLKKATPGKWNAYDWPSFPKQDEYDSCVRIESESRITAFCFSGKPNHDALLIANCPTDLSTLLQIVKIQNDALEFYSKTHENDGAYVGQICFDRVQGNDCEVIGAFSIAGRKARQAIQQVNTLVSGGK